MRKLMPSFLFCIFLLYGPTFWVHLLFVCNKTAFQDSTQESAFYFPKSDMKEQNMSVF